MKKKVVIGYKCVLLVGLVSCSTHYDVNYMSQSLQNVSDIVDSMQKEFERNDYVSFVDTAFSFLERTSIFYQMQTALFDEPNTIEFLNVSLGKIKENLDNISTIVDNVKHDAFRRLISANMHEQQTTIFKSSDKLNECSRHLSLLSFDDRQFSHSIDIVNCYDKSDEFRQFGTLLTTPDIFDNIIKGMGQFNGNVIMSVYQYLLGFYTQGCMTITVAESLKYKTSQTSIKEECVASLRSAILMLDKINEKCRDESCTNLNKYLKQLSNSVGIDKVASDIQSYYPCFRFLILQFSKGTDPNKKLEGDVLNNLEIQYDQRIDMLFWTDKVSKQYSPNEPLHQYSLQFSNSSLQDIFNGIHLQLDVSTVSSGRIRLVGYTEYPVRSNKCKDTVIDTVQDDDCSGLECTIELEKYLPYVVVPVVGFVLLIIIIIETVVIDYLCRRKRINNKHDKKFKLHSI